MLKLIQHLVVQHNGILPEIPDCLYAYIMAGNGVLIYAKRPGLEVLIPVLRERIVGLPALEPYVHLSQRIPKCLLLHALKVAQTQLPNEILFWFNSKQYWTLQVPQQITGPSSTMPVESLDVIGTSALVDLHSHGLLRPFFSTADNKDEQGFRIYAVIGQLDKSPGIRVRVGVYGHYFDIGASEVFEMPSELLDILEKEGRQNESTTEYR